MSTASIASARAVNSGGLLTSSTSIRSMTTAGNGVWPAASWVWAGTGVAAKNSASPASVAQNHEGLVVSLMMNACTDCEVIGCHHRLWTGSSRRKDPSDPEDALRCPRIDLGARPGSACNEMHCHGGMLQRRQPNEKDLPRRRLSLRQVDRKSTRLNSSN